MSEETLMTEPTATTTEGEAASTTASNPDATGAQSEGQQQPQAPETPEEGQDTEAPDEGAEEEPKDEEGAPEQYEFKAPEGQEFDGQVIDSFSDIAKELNLPQATAQAILDKMTPVLAQRQAEQIAQASEQWRNDSIADKEFGGEKLQENMAVAIKARDAFASPELQQLLDASGMGNHPEIIRLFYRVGKAISEDGFVAGGKGEAKPRTAKSFYANSDMN